MKQSAVLEWRDGLPYSPVFNDVYFSVSADHAEYGLAETRHVFLTHNRLAERWQKLPTDRPSHFVIVETGFGSGLNFLACLQLWLATAPPLAHLHFVSIECAPFSQDDLQRAHARFSSLAPFSQALCQQYTLLQPGINTLAFPDYRTSLNLHIGDCLDILPQLNLHADAWFLDGFAPAKNPQMWQAPLYSSMARSAHAGTTFATFTSAGEVRRGLQAAGFAVQKVAGFGKKRDMLCGHWPADTALPPAHRLPKVAVIGAGIAGCSTAWHLAQYGCQVTVVEQADAPASGASGNPRGMLYPRLNAEKPQNDMLAWRSYSYTLRHYKALKLPKQAFETCGLLQLGGSPREHKRVQKVAARYADWGVEAPLLQRQSAEAATAQAGVPLTHDCLYFPAGSWVNPQLACAQQVAHPNITLQTQQRIVALQTMTVPATTSPSEPPSAQASAGQHWILQTAHQQTLGPFDAVVVCNAADAADLLPESGLWLNPVRGQMGMFASHPDMQSLTTILCGDGYLTPARDGAHAMGATFAPGDTQTDVREEDTQRNLQMVSQLSPQFAQVMQAQMLSARAALRCGSPDYLPYVGAVSPVAQLQSLPTPADSLAALPASQGVYVHVAHGSKGLLTAPYCAALLAQRVLADFGSVLPPLSEDSFWLGLHPQRLLFKQWGWKALIQPFKPAWPPVAAHPATIATPAPVEAV